MTLPPIIIEAAQAAPSKPWWKSRTIGVNVLSLVAFAVGLILDNACILTLDPHAVIWGGIGLTVINAGLRLVTFQPLTDTPGAAAAASLPPH